MAVRIGRIVVQGDPVVRAHVFMAPTPALFGYRDILGEPVQGLVQDAVVNGKSPFPVRASLRDLVPDRIQVCRVPEHERMHPGVGFPRTFMCLGTPGQGDEESGGAKADE